MNSAVVILAIIVRKGIWKLKGQLLSFKNANEFSINLEDDNIFNTTGIKPTGKYELADIISNNNHHSFFHNIPVRQTDIFEGRKDELKNYKNGLMTKTLDIV